MGFDGEQASAEFSMDRKYRHRLDRWWGDGERLLWVMLNPSTADEHADDATLRRVRRFTKREGYDGFTVINLFSLVATDPADLNEISAFAISMNAQLLADVPRGRDVVVAWGARPYRFSKAWTDTQATEIQTIARRVRSLGVTNDGYPRHPLRLRRDTPLLTWQPTIAMAERRG